MEVRVRLFAALRERAGTDEIAVELPEGARVNDALARLGGLIDGIPVVMAINREYAESDALLAPGDEVALIPPVSGGAVAALHIRVTDEPLVLDDLIERVRDPRAGAITTFLGVTREVPELEYEAYVEMAHREIAEIVSRATERHRLCAAAVEHRIGTVALSSGRAEISMADSPVAAYQVKQSSGAFKLVGPTYGTAPYGLALPKKSGLAPAVLAALKVLMSNGTYASILSKWGIQSGALPASQVKIDGAAS